MRELRALVDAYAMAVDERDGPALVSLFTPAGVLAVVGPDGAEDHRYVGREEIGTVTAKLARYDATLHLVSTHRCREDGDRGSGTAYCEAHHRFDGRDRVRFMRYDDVYERVDGVWHFGSRSARTLWIEER